MDSDMSGMDDMSSTSSNSTMDMKMYFHGTIGTDMLWFASWMPSSAGATVGVCIGLFLFAVFERYLISFRRACDAAWRKGQVGYCMPTCTGNIDSTGLSTSLPTPVTLSRLSSTQKYDTASPRDYPVDQDQDVEPVTPYTSSTQHQSSSAPSYSQAEKPHKTNSQIAGSKEKGVEMENIHSHLPKAVRRTLDPGREGRWSRPFRWAVDVPRGLLQSLQTAIHYLLMLVVMTFNIWWIIAVVIGSGVGEMLFGRFGSSHAGH